MNQKKTVWDLLNHVFSLFGITVLCLILFVILFGEDAGEVSTIFQLGSKGIAITTLFQYFFMSLIISVLRMLFFTDRVIKNASIAVRTVAMFVSIILVIAAFAGIFGWFPVRMWQAWLAFLVCFIVCAAVSTVISVIKEKSDNKKLQDALINFCEGEET